MNDSAGIRQIGDNKNRGLFVVLNPHSHTLYGGGMHQELTIAVRVREADSPVLSSFFWA